MAFAIRCAEFEDLFTIQVQNLKNLPENYSFKYYTYVHLSWPSLCFVAESLTGEPMGYVLCKTEEKTENGLETGHVTSLAVSRPARGAELGKQLMDISHLILEKLYKCTAISLQVRVDNEAAIKLYKDKFNYEIIGTEANYYEDGVDAYKMQLTIKKQVERKSAKTKGNIKKKK